MPLFTVHLPAQRYSVDQKKKIADCLAQSLVIGFGLPVEDRFVVIHEHTDDNMSIHPTYMDMKRTPNAMIISVQIPDTRPVAEKRKLLKAIVELLRVEVGVDPDDVFISLVPIPPENFSFGRGFSPFDKENS